MNKKVAIITWCDNNGPTNYGQIFQCYAIQKICEKLGFEAIIVQYRKKTEIDFCKNKFKSKYLNQIYEELFKIIVIEKNYNKRIYLFRRFIKENIELSSPCYDKRDVEKLVRDCSYLLCGSDQIWNPIWYDPMFFLDFGHTGQKRIAYAPSGIANDDNETEVIYTKMGSLINRIDCVSMRESQGIQIMKKYTDKNIEAVLDPTLLLERKDWDKIASKRLVDEPYIFCYTMGSLRQHKLVLRQIMKKHNATRIVFIPSNVVEAKLQLATPYTTAGPAQFISLIKYAEAVATDSFHGTTLSIKYKKQFYLLKRMQQDCYRWASFSRIDNILDKMHIDGRLVSNIKDIKNISEINYDIVDIYGNTEIEKSKHFLQKALSQKNDL